MVLHEWMRSFIKKHLVLQPTQIQRHIFFIQWNNATQKLNPDIGGSMVKAIITANEILQCKPAQESRRQEQQKIRSDGTNIAESIDPSLENMSIVMEIYKYFGKELNLVLVYEIFKQVH